MKHYCIRLLLKLKCNTLRGENKSSSVYYVFQNHKVYNAFVTEIIFELVQKSNIPEYRRGGLSREQL